MSSRTEEIAMMGIGVAQRNLGEDEEARRIQRGIEQTMRGIIADKRVAEPRSMAAPAQSTDEPWKTAAAEVPIRPPSGIEICDRMMDRQDEKDRMETLSKYGLDELKALQKAVRARMIELAAEERREK